MVGHASLPRARQEHLLRQVELHGSVSAADIAQQLGVSQVTIRRDIVELENAGKLVRVHGGAIAATAPPVAQSARANIGVVVPSAMSHFPEIIRGMDAASHGARTRVVLATSQYREDLERRQVERLVEIGVAGIVLAPTMRNRSEEELASWVARLPVPVVFLERRLESTALAAFDSVRTDHARGAVLAVEHLAGLGHRRVGVALYDRTPTAPLVAEGHSRAAAQLGLESAPQVALPKGGDSESDALDEAMAAFLEECARTGTTAALVHTDVHAARLVELAMDRGIRVPDDLAVVAYDDDTAGLAMVPLTAITAPGRDLGAEVMRTLNARLAEPSSTQSAPRHITMLPRLTVRGSCGAKS